MEFNDVGMMLGPCDSDLRLLFAGFLLLNFEYGLEIF